MLAVVVYVNLKDIIALVVLALFAMFFGVLWVLDILQNRRMRAKARRDEAAALELPEIECSEFLCLPEINPSHYVNGIHRPVRGPS